MEEKRKLPRKYLRGYSSVYEQGTGKILGNLCDLSLGGLMLISQESLEADKEVSLYIDLPEIISYKDRTLKFKARVAWLQPDVEPGINNIGFQFFKFTEEKKLVVTQIIETYELFSS